MVVGSRRPWKSQRFLAQRYVGISTECCRVVWVFSAVSLTLAFALVIDKQFLVTRNVPCQTRVASMENHLATEEAGDGEDWLVSSLKKETNLEDDFDILDQDGELMQKKDDSNDAGNGGDDDEYADMDAFEDNNVLQDVVAASSPVHDQQESNLLKVRTYDLSITYDKYYQTPRVWMLGKSAEGQPLSGKEMMEDVMSDYANRTVTIENHPHLAAPHASVHPCQHGKVMKTIVKNLIKASTTEGEEDKGPSVEMYLFIFLKFVSSIIPTISYDFTMDVTADTSK
jgi:ubiquitin-like-conjugating enzyme ATG3